MQLTKLHTTIVTPPDVAAALIKLNATLKAYIVVLTNGQNTRVRFASLARATIAAA